MFFCFSCFFDIHGFEDVELPFCCWSCLLLRMHACVRIVLLSFCSIVSLIFHLLKKMFGLLLLALNPVMKFHDVLNMYTSIYIYIYLAKL